MMVININILAKEMNISINTLVQICIQAGIVKNKYDYITRDEKKTLEEYLKRASTISNNTLTLKRKTRSTLNVSSIGGKNKYVHIEIRKHKTYIKHNDEVSRNIFKNTSSSLNNNYRKPSSNLGNKNDSTIYSIQNTTQDSHISNNLNKNLNVKSIKKKDNVVLKNIEHDNASFKKVELKRNVNLQNSTFSRRKKNKEKKENRIQPVIENRNRYNVSQISHVHRFIHSVPNKDNNRSRYNKSVKNTYNKKNKNYFDKKFNSENLKNSTYIEKSSKQSNNSILQQVFKKPSSVINRDIIIKNFTTVYELANKMAVKSSEVIKKMMKLGYIVTINQSLDKDIAQLVAEEMGHKVLIYHENKLEHDIMKCRNVSNKKLQFRPPIVTVMGHVDHGKTSLLDYIRLTNIASKEAGGITQHIGAYHIEVNNKVITFLDTPGHAAFTAMRSRGAQITDIVVLVVAADDGVKPQTIEAIQHAQAASAPILIAINKIDKLNAEPEKIKTELMKYNIVTEEWGGDNIFVNVSAKTGKGIDDLLKFILLQAEMLELKTTITGMAEGLVIESFLDKGQGPIATILIREGTLNKGDIVLCGLEYGKIRAIKNSMGKEIRSVGPSIPVEILGLSGIPIAGDKIIVVSDEKKAKEVAMYRQTKFREKKLSKKTAFKLSNIFETEKHNHALVLNIILKADVQGSLQAISDSLSKLSNNNVVVKLIGQGVGGITETDASLAIASKAIIIGFNVRADFSAKRIIESENLDLRYYSVIYHIIDEIKNAMLGMTSPKYKQEITGLAEVRSIFKSPSFGNIAGCMVIEGIVKRHDLIRVLRQNKVIYEGELESLKRFKEDVKEIRNGVECGIKIKNYNDIHINDLIESFRMLEI
ncbi:MAG: translation initiation factor IF-2 [Buchnera aphidicola (Schlechtendalia peitan)]